MRPKSLLILFLIVIGLGAFIWFFERDLPGTDERAQLDQRVLTVEAEEITEFVIERGGVTVRLSRPASTEQTADADTDDASRVRREWRLLEPFGVRADSRAADRLATALADLEKVRKLEDVEPAAVGLDEPRAVVTVRTPDSEWRLAVGARVPASQNMVVARDSEVFVVANAVWDSISTESGEWRGRDLLPLHKGAVERIEVSSATTSWALARRAEDDFWIDSPIEDLAENESVDQFLNAMFDSEIVEFIDQTDASPAEMGLEPPTTRLSVSFVGRDEPVVLEIGSPMAEGAIEKYARMEGQLITLGDDLDEALGRAPAEWQSTAWTTLEVFEVDALRATDGEGELLLERAGADWERDGVKISYSPVSDFLYALTGVSGTRVMARAEADTSGVDLSNASLQLELKGGDGGESLSLYAAAGGRVAAREGRSFLLDLSEGTVEDLLLKLQAIRDEPVLADEDPAEQEG